MTDEQLLASRERHARCGTTALPVIDQILRERGLTTQEV